MDSDEPVLVALSGGADSSCLLHLVADYAAHAGCKVFAAHVNHGIRTEAYGFEAARDEQFCRELCASLGVTLFVKQIDAPELAKTSGKSLETAARDARYEFFAQIMRENGIKILSTAHNADDVLETQIFNLCRGSSIDGLCGIPRTRAMNGIEDGIIVRPILDATKQDILELCEKHGIAFVTDSTNLEDDCTRNRIRHNVIPELVALFGTPQRAAMRLSGNAAEDSLYIKNAALQFIDEQGDTPDVTALSSLAKPVLARALCILFKNACGASLEAIHVDGLCELIASGKEAASISLPSRMRACIKRGKLVFEADKRQKSAKKQSYSVAVSSGVTLIDGTLFAVSVDSPVDDVSYELYDKQALRIDPEKPLYASPRQGGDLILSSGMHKRIKKLLCDNKIDIEDRDTMPIIRQNGVAVYVPRCAVADSAKIDRESKKITIFIYKKTI